MITVEKGHFPLKLPGAESKAKFGVELSVQGLESDSSVVQLLLNSFKFVVWQVIKAHDE